MNERLQELEVRLRATGKYWIYVTNFDGESASDEEKIRIAELVLRAPKSWARGLAEEFQTRRYPPGFNDSDEEK